jgi:quinol monooxygenase YgiN
MAAALLSDSLLVLQGRSTNDLRYGGTLAAARRRSGKNEAILGELAKAIRKEPGNVQFTVHRSRDAPVEFLLYEVYSSEEAFRQHQQTEHFKTLVLDRAVPLLSVRERCAYSIVDNI